MRINKKGCSPDGDVCMAHHRPLICRHGCRQASSHRCAGYESLSSVTPDKIVTEPDEYLKSLPAEITDG